MAELALAGLQKVYAGGVTAIRGIDLTVGDGELVVIVGPSGCGKSTLLRLVAGLERPTQGSVRVGERAVDRLEPAQRDIAMVFQNYALYPHMSVYKNMAYALRNKGTPKATIEERVQSAARTLELEGLLERKPRQLSGGQRQRVAMGRAIVRDPAVFLFDEPLSNLDAKLRVQMRVEIKSLQRRLATTSLYVTHDQVEAMTLADRLVVMNAGVAEQIDTPLAIYERPASRFVGSFIGSPAMNFLAGEIDAERQTVAVDEAAHLPLDPSVHREVTSGPVSVGVRPEHIGIAGGSPRTPAMRVDLVEALGSETLLYGRLPSGTALTVRAQGVPRVTEGEQVPLQFAAEHLHLFDADSGLRLGSGRRDAA